MHHVGFAGGVEGERRPAPRPPPPVPRARSRAIFRPTKFAIAAAGDHLAARPLREAEAAREPATSAPPIVVAPGLSLKPPVFWLNAAASRSAAAPGTVPAPEM